MLLRLLLGLLLAPPVRALAVQALETIAIRLPAQVVYSDQLNWPGQATPRVVHQPHRPMWANRLSHGRHRADNHNCPLRAGSHHGLVPKPKFAA